jgi:hypothetical protein
VLFLLFSSHTSLVVCTTKRATAHDLASIEQNIKPPSENPYLFPQDKRLPIQKLFTVLVFGKCSFENIGTSLSSFWLYHDKEKNDMKFPEIILGVSQ